MIVEFFANLDVTNFPTRRILDVATRVSMAFARLHFSNVVTAEIAKKALTFLADVFRDFDNTVVVIEDPREIVCKEIADFYMQRPNIPYDFNDTVESIKNRSSMLETYLGDGKGLDTQSHKFRDLRGLSFSESPKYITLVPPFLANCERILSNAKPLSHFIPYISRNGWLEYDWMNGWSWKTNLV
jgi:hypothetical protein